MKSNYRPPLAICFVNLNIYIKQKVALAVATDPQLPTNGEEKGSNRASRLENACEKLQLWLSMLDPRHPKSPSPVGDVLEVIDLLDPGLREKLHKIFLEIAIHISEYDSKGGTLEIRVEIKNLT